MNTNTESRHTVEQDNTRLPKLIASSTAATLGLGLVAVGLLLAAPCAKGETKLSTADESFILAAAQGGMTEVKLGELAAQKGTREDRSEEHTSELQSLRHLVCRLLLEK